MDTLKLVYTQLEAFDLVEEYTEAYKKKIKELEKENRSLKKEKGRIRQRLVALEKNLETLSRVKENKELRKENKNLKKERDLYKARNEELNENCFGLSKENKKLKSDLSECECSMHFENDEVGYRKREVKSGKKKIKHLKNG